MSRARIMVLGLLVLVAVGLPVVYLVAQPPPTATGIVVAIRHNGPLAVSSFDLRTVDGQILTFDVGPLDLTNGGFNAAHLTAHSAAAEPVQVTYRREGDRMVAIRLVDEPYAAVPAAT